MINTFIDFHCHPAMKPYGKSFPKNKIGSSNKKDKSCIWHYDPPNLIERAVQLFVGMSKFTQADMTTLIYGNVQIVCASIYPIERGFFKSKLGTATLPSDALNNFVTCLGKSRVDAVQCVTDYFTDLQCEYDFYKQLENQKVNTEVGACTYKMVSSYTEIENHCALSPDAERTVFIIPTIEGMHALHSNIDAPNETNVMSNLAKMRAWDHPPFFVTIGHHFYNHLCGHARSFSGILASVTDQEEGINTGFTPLGEKVIDALLKKDARGRRVLIDIKHMSAQSRKEYFKILATKYAGDQVPIIASHAAMNGLRSMDNPVADVKETSPNLLAEDINFYDDEIVAVAKSGGIMGLQLDERRLASATALKNMKHAIPMNKIRHYRAELFWNQIQHTAEVLNNHDLFAWDILALGTDFDGGVDALNGFLTAEAMPELLSYTERYAYTYMQGRGKQVLKSYNQISPSEIVNRVFSDNGLAFLKKWFR